MSASDTDATEHRTWTTTSALVVAASVIGVVTGAAAQPKTPISTPPASEAARPSGETAPEVPGSTGCPVVTSRAGRRLSTPSSVAQVSAVTAASAPL